MHDIARLGRKRFDARAKTLGLTRAQWQALANLRRQEGVSQAGLAEMLDLEPITVARLIDRMEEAGWVERRPDAADRRVHRLYIADRARPVMTQLEAISDVLLEEAFTGLSPRECDLLIDLLQRVRGNLSERVVRAGELMDSQS
jgi:MarR family transcriptional regulator, transcriptional regulator for hemolysin